MCFQSFVFCLKAMLDLRTMEQNGCYAKIIKSDAVLHDFNVLSESVMSIALFAFWSF